MYVIKRTDKEFGDPTVIHGSYDEAEGEAKRLAMLHAKEKPEFTIYKLKEVSKIKSENIISVWYNQCR